MKRRLNILCVLVVLVLAVSVSRSAYYFGIGATTGFKGSWERKTEDLGKLMNVKAVSLLPDDFLNFQDSVYNTISGEYVPVMYSQLGVSMPFRENAWGMAVSILSTYMHLFAAVGAFIIFIFIIVSVNKSNIFTWKNVSRLRWLGGLLIISFIGSVVPHVITYIILSKQFDIQGYSLSLDEVFSVITLALGLVSYVFAEIFAIGLRMKEEQDLTI